MQKALGTALAGLVLGAIVVPLAIGAFAPLGFLIFAAFAGLAGLRQESRGFGGGLLIAFGSWWVYFVGRAVERCDVLNRQPGASCAIYGTNEQLALAGSVVLVGALLVAIALRQKTATA